MIKSVITVSSSNFVTDFSVQKQTIIVGCVYIPCDGLTFYIELDEKDGEVELDILLRDIVQSEDDIFLTGD